MTKPVISIITVTYQAEKFLLPTIQSVASQQYPHIEYIVVDGDSKDQTLDIIRSNENVISQWISEPDRGIYDAMNKGLSIATGDYVLFLNAGDRFYSPETLNIIFGFDGFSNADIYYGETIEIDENGQEIGMRRLKAPRCLTWKSFKWGMLVCHQSVFVKRTLTEPYDMQYAISSDYDWVLRMLKKSQQISNTHVIVSAYMDGGFSRNNMRKANWERFLSMKKHYGCLPAFGYNFLLLFRFLWTLLVVKRF